MKRKQKGFPEVWVNLSAGEVVPLEKLGYMGLVPVPQLYQLAVPQTPDWGVDRVQAGLHRTPPPPGKSVPQGWSAGMPSDIWMNGAFLTH